jgi:Tfp pilus assembly PilM family ATPase
MDEARVRLGLKSRMDLIRRALHAYLDQAGEREVAALFAVGDAAELGRLHQQAVRVQSV